MTMTNKQLQALHDYIDAAIAYGIATHESQSRVHVGNNVVYETEVVNEAWETLAALLADEK